MKNNLPDVAVTISRQTSAPRLYGIHALYSGCVAQIADSFRDQRNTFFEPILVGVGTDDVGRVERKVNIASGRDAHGLFRVRCHFLGMKVDRTSFSFEKRVFEAADARFPLASRFIQERASFLRIHQNRPGAPPKLYWERIQCTEHSRIACLRKPVHCDDAQVPLSDLWFDSTDEVLTGNHLIQINRDLRQHEEVIQARDTAMQIPKQ